MVENYLIVKKNYKWFNNFCLFSFVQIFLYFIFFILVVDNRNDFMGIQELNFWFEYFGNKEIMGDVSFQESFGSNYIWIRFLNNFNILPIDSYLDVISIGIISKLIQLSFFSICFKFLGKNYWILYVIYFIPINFLSMNGVGRSSIDIPIICAVSIFTFYKPRLSILFSLISIIGKFLITFIGFFGFFIENFRISNKFKFIFLSILLISLFIILSPIYLQDIQTSYLYKLPSGKYGSYLLDIYPSNKLLFLIRCLLSLMPPIFLAFNFLPLLGSLGHFIYFIIIFRYRKSFNINYIFVILIFSILGSPGMFNLLNAARYSNMVYTFVTLSTLIVFKKKQDNNVFGKNLYLSEK